MSKFVEYTLNQAPEEIIAKHLLCCDSFFLPPLSSRVVISEYAKKISSKAVRFEAWSDNTLVGLVATYCNDQENGVAYITSVSVMNEWKGRGIAACLMNRCIRYAKSLGMQQICLEVGSENLSAIRLYEKAGFIADFATRPFVTMNLYLKSGERV